MNKAKILIVDDAVDNVLFLKTILRLEEYTFLEAYNGKEAIELALKENPDLILMDAVMPEMDGFEATSVIKASEVTERTPVLMITALQERDKKIEALEKGVTDFISKPFDKAELIARCRSLVKMSELNNRYISASNNPVTNLPNKTALSDTLHFMQDPKLFLVGIDNFDEFTEFYGYEEGEQLEANYGEQLRTALCEKLKEGWELYHISDGKFGFLYDDTEEDLTEDNAHNVCEIIKRFMSDIAEKLVDHEYALTFTIGFAFGSDKLLERANLALHESLKQKKEFLFDQNVIDKVNFEIQSNVYWVKKLQKAFELDHIIPYFQPIYDVKTGKIAKFETLARLVKEDGGIVTPFQFLDAAKRARLYPRLTEAMVNKSFDVFSRHPYEFSINLSAIDIQSEETQHFIIMKLKGYPQLARRVVFEILESESIDNHNMFSSFIRQVKHFGARVAMDDFGSGYSNFSRLLELDVDYLKLDGSLIRNIDYNQDSEDITRIIQEFSRKKVIKTVAEFVHNESVYRKIRELEIDYAQGFFLGEPRKEI